MTNSILREHFNKNRKSLIELSMHFDIVKHGTIKGNLRESLINEFLQKNLPTCVDYLSGEIIDINNTTSGQIDIILQSTSDPRIQLYKYQHIALCDAVLAIIEVKSNLTTGKPDGHNSFVQALSTFKKVKLLDRKEKIKSLNKDYPDKETIPCLLFTYKGPSREVLVNAITAYSRHHKYGQKEFNKYLPEVIVVLNKGYYLYKEDGWIFKIKDINKIGTIYPHIEKEDTLIGMFVYLCNIIQSWNNNKHISNYVDYLK